ncbi:MAG: TldD/PmbA family protein, partial [Erysipelotrichaceae bacterium]|nr:TldD/PmbA family protein [Erysipelotrichaceae bacterium]
MLNTLVTYLKEKGIDYRIKEFETISNEFYFIGNKLDMNRKNDVSYIELTVYIKNEDGTLGVASEQLHPTMSEEEMKSAVENLIYAASFAKNPVYELAEAV